LDKSRSKEVVIRNCDKVFKNVGFSTGEVTAIVENEDDQ
jgi:hypothetical protein